MGLLVGGYGWALVRNWRGLATWAGSKNYDNRPRWFFRAGYKGREDAIKDARRVGWVGLVMGAILVAVAVANMLGP